jgi:hypothetical protein
MDDEIEQFLETQIRDRLIGKVQVELSGLDKQEALAALRRVCIPLAQELHLDIWARTSVETDIIWVVEWIPKAGFDPKMKEIA